MLNNETSPKNKIRAFICLDFPPEIIKESARIQAQIESKNLFTGKITEPENLHITLKFLGEIEKEKIETIKQKLSKIKFSPLNLHLESVGVFNFKGNPRILWLKVAGKEIFNLQKQIDLSLKEEFPPEKRFMSHLTIARIKFTKDKKYFFEYLKSIKCKKIKFQVNSFHLKQSTLKRFGPVYEIIESYNSA